jgi:hypothetical protein
MTTLFPSRASASAALLTLVLGGCSFAFVDGPPSMHKQLPYFECTSSRAWPTVDLVVGGITGIEAVTILSADSSLYSDTRTEAAIAAGEAALFIASAIYGYDKASSCREAKDELMQRLYRQPAGPGFGPGLGGAPYQQPPYDPWVSPPPGAFARPHAPPSVPSTGTGPPATPSPATAPDSPDVKGSP